MINGPVRANPQPFDTMQPSWQGDTNQPMMGGGGGFRPRMNPMGSPAATPSTGAPPATSGQGGYAGYLQGLGWNPDDQSRMQFAQGLRADGSHPFEDWLRSQHPNWNFTGGSTGNTGGNMGPYGGFLPSQGGWPTQQPNYDPRPSMMNSFAPQASVLGPMTDFSGMARRRYGPIPRVQR